MHQCMAQTPLSMAVCTLRHIVQILIFTILSQWPHLQCQLDCAHLLALLTVCMHFYATLACPFQLVEELHSQHQRKVCWCHSCRFRDHPIIKGEPHFRFYVGCPLVTFQGNRIGSL